MLPKLSTLLLTSLLLIAFEKTYAQKTREPFSGNILYGKVARVIQIEYMSKKPSDTMVMDTALYDRNGILLERRTGARLGKEIVHYIYKYTTKFDDNGHKVETVFYSQGDKGVLKYDLSGNMIEFDNFLSNGNLSYKYLYKYNDRNNRTEYSIYDKKDSLNAQWLYRYNKNDNLIEEYKDKGLKYESKILYQYQSFDEIGNWTRRSRDGKFKIGYPIGEMITERQFVYY
ncbi:hypothetical protein G7092_17855 [Mucilaginibacter sp. HC2]|uniref:hypothetical protein n=1 Tax=Mucilaginibacter inviolabilis TaxID=2714892 RepID=UPI00140CE4B8|nr:hypothetical protein [Mucilaginibacter inviolabilis]NHA05681.1 hypothetical protein [Mucilaginibacter inviolabilis]